MSFRITELQVNSADDDAFLIVLVFLCHLLYSLSVYTLSLLQWLGQSLRRRSRRLR